MKIRILVDGGNSMTNKIYLILYVYSIFLFFSGCITKTELVRGSKPNPWELIRGSKPNLQPCVSDMECASSYCCNGVCCNSNRYIAVGKVWLRPDGRWIIRITCWVSEACDIYRVQFGNGTIIDLNRLYGDEEEIRDYRVVPQSSGWILGCMDLEYCEGKIDVENPPRVKIWLYMIQVNGSNIENRPLMLKLPIFQDEYFYPHHPINLVTRRNNHSTKIADKFFLTNEQNFCPPSSRNKFNSKGARCEITSRDLDDINKIPPTQG
jgi:hypothetical protein